MAGNIYQVIQIDDQSVTPKYVQLANSILKGVEKGIIGEGYLLPSINDLSYELDISRDTAEKAYKRLKKMGIIGSVPGKGFFITQASFRQNIKVFLLFNKLSSHKKIIYDSFVATLGEQAAIDFYIYNNDFSLFKKLLNNRKEDYTHYVIVPHFLEDGEKAPAIINALETENLILLDKQISGITLPYAAVYENFEKDIYGALEGALHRLEKYQTIKIIFPSYTYFPVEIIKGFVSFCQQYAFNYRIVPSIKEEQVHEGEVYINLMEEDLVVLIENIMAAKLTPGKDVGIISYNETPLKKILLNGITTISTNFSEMGKLAAQMILNEEKGNVEVPFTLTLRDSL